MEGQFICLVAPVECGAYNIWSALTEIKYTFSVLVSIDRQSPGPKMSKKKKATMLFKMVSTAGTGFFYVGEKSTKYATRKMQLRKYDPMVNMHVLFTE